ncbi:hypothetical protein D3C80_1408840 [compost metagenome]
MTSVSLLKIAALGSLLASSTIAGTAIADYDILTREQSAEGLFKEPICDYDFRIKKGLSTLLGEQPTGITASNSKWDMELYANPTRGNWTLVGKSKEPTTSSIKKLCTLASGLSDNPYTQEVWFRKYFQDTP